MDVVAPTVPTALIANESGFATSRKYASVADPTPVKSMAVPAVALAEELANLNESPSTRIT